MKTIAIVMVLAGAAVAQGGVMEFVYYGPGTPQFLAGLVATPAGALAVLGGLALWRRGIASGRFVVLTAAALLAGTIAATALAVMGPPATLVGVIGSLLPLGWVGTQRRVHRQQP